MRFTLSFDCGNSAFFDDVAPEVARILREIANQVENGAAHSTIRDINGNIIGNFIVKID